MILGQQGILFNACPCFPALLTLYGENTSMTVCVGATHEVVRGGCGSKQFCRSLTMFPLSAAATQDVVVSNWGDGWTVHAHTHACTHKQMNKHTLPDCTDRTKVTSSM